MANLSCGRVYNGFDAAWTAAELRSLKGSGALQIDSCNLHPDAPDAFHIRPAKGKKASTRVCDECGGPTKSLYNLVTPSGDDLDFCSLQCVVDWATIRLGEQ